MLPRLSSAYTKLTSGPSAGSLTLAAGQDYTWVNGTCTIAVANVDTVSYTICYETIVSASHPIRARPVTTIHRDPMTSYRHTTLLSRVTPASERRQQPSALVPASLVTPMWSRKCNVPTGRPPQKFLTMFFFSESVDHECSCLPEHRDALLQEWIGVGMTFLDPSTG
jgi:hypothetical protein